MRIEFGTGVLVTATMMLSVGCSKADPDAAVRRAVLSCVVEGGGSVGDDADVVVGGGRALAVSGTVDASTALIGRCLDRATP